MSWRVDPDSDSMKPVDIELHLVPRILRDGVGAWWERVNQSPLFAHTYAELPTGYRAELTRVVACSEFVAAALIQDPGALAWLARYDEPREVLAAQATYEREVATAHTIEEAQRLLRVWRRRVMVRIAWRDIVGRAGVRETLWATSDFADASIRAAAMAAQRDLCGVFGTPRDANGEAVPFVVLGMGKLGGRELNFSSDIDLLFLFSQPGTTDGAREIDNEEYFNRLGRHLIRLLDARTDDGFVFRVDMRLRPFGDSGPLVVSLDALEDYLQQHGRDWERYAWIKARPILGADTYAATYRDCVRPFVYRRYLDFGVFESLRDMKALIAREVSRRELERHLKLGAGGIREIEFIAQSFQLVRGGSDLRLQNASLLEVLPVLAGSKLLPADAMAELTEAYLVLRKAENGLQMMRDAQTHTLPEELSDWARLALMMGASGDTDAGGDSGASGEAEVGPRIEFARQATARHFAALVFGADSAPRLGGENSFGWLASDEIHVEQELVASGFPPAEAPPVAVLLETYRQAAPYRRLDETGRRRLHLILGRLMKAAALRPAPAVMVERVLRVLEAIGARASYLALLVEQPAALDRLVEVCGISGFLAHQIAGFPLLLDELIDAKAFNELPTRAGFVRELAARTEQMPADDPERQVEALRQFQKVAVFSVALADLTGRLPLMKVSDRLTDIAELIVQCCMDLAWQQMTDTYGAPLCGKEPAGLRPVRWAAAAYGKLGGLELGYGSDLDLVFLHDSGGDIQATQGSRSIDNVVFFLRLGQRVVHLLTMHSAAGRLYEVDTRLRPNGKGGFLVTGIDAFERYQREEAWTWEYQALLRARAVAGDSRLCARFETVRLETLQRAVHRDTLRSDVAEMRERMRRELSKAGANQFDIKQDQGGIADIEFLVQYWVLEAAQRHPELLTYTDNIRQLEGLARVGVVDGATAQWLMDAYRGYRAVLHLLSLEGQGERVVEAADHAVTRLRIGEIWRSVFDLNLKDQAP